MNRPILDFSAYYVNEYGEVSNSKGKVLSQYKDNVGYQNVVLFKNGKRYYKRVHRLVWEAFNGKVKDGKIVNHMDCNKSNNDISNLEALTTSENVLHFYQNSSSTVYNIDVHRKVDGHYIGRFTSIRALGRELALNRKTLTSILKGENANNYPYVFTNLK